VGEVMSEFKSQAEVWQALLDGKTVEDSHYKYKFADGRLMWSHIGGNSWGGSERNFTTADQYYIYTEPKQKKIVRMAPALILADEYRAYYVDGKLFSSEISARNYHYGKFIKWLIDTHGVDVEVDDE
jgi:hypothetical protein